MKNKKILVTALLILIIPIVFGAVVALNYFQAKVFSIKVADQAVTDSIIIDSVNIPQNGFVYVFQKNKNMDNGLYVGSSQFLKKGKYNSIEVLVNKDAKERISADNDIFVARLVNDTTGDRVFDTLDDAPIKSVFGFEYQKEFLRI